jgi:aspartate beta-hydroxylase
MIDVRELAQSGIEALRGGDALTARARFEQIVAAGRADTSLWVALAVACQALGDGPAMLAAAEQALALDGRNVRALIVKGDYLAATGNPRAATTFYGAAVALAEREKELPPGTEQAVRHASAARQRITARIEAHLRERLAAVGYDATVASHRFSQSLDLLTGRKKLFLQQPRAYYFPELPQVQFYPRDAFPWLDAIERATDDICAELAEVMEEDKAFVPYIQSHADMPVRPGVALLDSPDWTAFFLCKDGEPVAKNAARCPKTLAALEHAPLARVTKRAPSILFSRLKPGAHIPAHTGYLNTRLICHLPLIVPAGCRFRVGNDEREWVRGKAWIFDDTIEHEAWNASAETRVVLIFDIWRPELTADERDLVSALLEAVDTFDGRRATWD